MIPAADLELQKNAPSGSVAPGDTVTFTLTLVKQRAEPGGRAHDHRHAPGRAHFRLRLPGCTPRRRRHLHRRRLGLGRKQATVTITTRAAVAAAGQTLTNTARRASTTPDPNSANNQTATTVDVRARRRRSRAGQGGVPTLDRRRWHRRFTCSRVHNGGPDAARQPNHRHAPGRAHLRLRFARLRRPRQHRHLQRRYLPPDSSKTLYDHSGRGARCCRADADQRRRRGSTTPIPTLRTTRQPRPIDITTRLRGPPAASTTPTTPAPPPAQPDLVATKSASTASVAVGANVTFMLGVKNQGSGDAAELQSATGSDRIRRS